MEFILRGRIVPPETAHSLGITSDLVDDAVARAREIAHELAAMPATGLARAKRAVYEGTETHMDGGLAIENAAFLDVMVAEDAAPVVGEYLSLPLEERRAWLEKAKRP